MCNELNGEGGWAFVEERTRSAVAGIDHDFERLELLGIDIGQEMRHIGVRGIDAMAHPVARWRGKLTSFREPANGLQSIVAADRLGLLTPDLHALVIGRLV